MPEQSPRHSADLSPRTGNLPAAPEGLQAVRAEVMSLLQADEATFPALLDGYISKKASQLAAESSVMNVDAGHRVTTDFIPPNAEVLMSGISRPYHLDDPEAYKPALTFARQLFPSLTEQLPPEKVYVNAAIYGANYGQAAYFQSVSGDVHENEKISGDFISDDGPSPHSIAEFKGAALCLERASITHNALKLLGVESKLELGKLETMGEDGQTDKGVPHAFLVVVNDQGEHFIFDPTNPQIIKDESGLIADYKPAIYKLPAADTPIDSGELREYTRTATGETKVAKARLLTYSRP